MTNKEIQKRLVKDMQKDKDLKQYSKDIKELNQRQFNILLNVFKKVNKQTTGGWMIQAQLKNLLKQEKNLAIKSNRLAKKIAKDVLKIEKINLKWEEKSNKIDWKVIESKNN